MTDLTRWPRNTGRFHAPFKRAPQPVDERFNKAVNALKDLRVGIDKDARPGR